MLRTLQSLHELHRFLAHAVRLSLKTQEFWHLRANQEFSDRFQKRLLSCPRSRIGAVDRRNSPPGLYSRLPVLAPWEESRARPEASITLRGTAHRFCCLILSGPAVLSFMVVEHPL